MKIILVPDNLGRRQNTCISQRHALAMGLLVLVIVPGLVTAGAWKLMQTLNPPPPAPALPVDVEHLRAEVETQRGHLVELEERSREQLALLTREVGRLQARLSRVDAMGRRLMNATDVAAEEFDFGLEMGRGGPRLPAGGPVPREATLEELLADLNAEVDVREQQLGVLESLIVGHQVRQQVQPSGWPVTDGWVSSTFGTRVDPFTGESAHHGGIDIARRAGSPIKAVAGGVVTFSGRLPGYGLAVELDHGGGLTTRYAHNERNLVAVGDRIRRGQQIARVGSTGRSTGPHLHFEVRIDGDTVDPRPYLTASN